MTATDLRVAVAAMRLCLQAHDGVPLGVLGRGKGLSIILQSRKFSKTGGHNPCLSLTDLAIMHMKHVVLARHNKIMYKIGKKRGR